MGDGRPDAMRPETVRTVWITRAEPGARRTAERLAALGFEPIVSPLLTIRRLSPTLELDDVAALAFTSANGVDAFAALTPVRDRPVFAVGDATAAAASRAGFGEARSAGGDIADLARLLRMAELSGVVLHPTARERAGDLAALAGPNVRAITVYEAVETETPPPEPFDAVLIHSPRAGRAFAARAADRPWVARVAVAISEAAAVPLRGAGLKQIRIAEAPSEAAMIAALGKPGGSL